MMLRHLDLFSGIGGFSLGLERTGGFKTVAFCEIDPYCQRVLRKNWPEVPIEKDVRAINAEKYKPDVITGGYPCQPFSTAGKRRGEEDDRHLWPSMFAIIRATRPTWVIGENVAGHVTMGLDSVLSDLESEGYACRPFIIPACAAGAYHRRDRIWIVAHAAGKRCREKGELSSRSPQRTTSPSSASSNVSDAEPRQLIIACDKKANGEGQATRPINGCQYRKWPAEPRVGRVANGVPNRTHRLRALGNSVVPQIPQLIGEAILAAEAA